MKKKYNRKLVLFVLVFIVVLGVWCINISPRLFTVSGNVTKFSSLDEANANFDKANRHNWNKTNGIYIFNLFPKNMHLYLLNQENGKLSECEMKKIFPFLWKTEKPKGISEIYELKNNKKSYFYVFLAP